MKYKIFETSSHLLTSYEVLALEYSRAKKRREPIYIDEEDEVEELPTYHYNNYNYTFSMLVLNASIIEGVLRSLLSEIVSKNIEKRTILGKENGQTEASTSERLHYKFRDKLEVQGGWSKLKEQYSFYLNISLDKIIEPTVNESIEVLFVLRNVLAHGTALVQPMSEMNEDMKKIYPYTWQRKLQRVRVHLKKEFGHDDIFMNLAEYDVPIHFIKNTKKYFEVIESKITPLPERAKITIEKIKEYEFSKICSSF